MDASSHEYLRVAHDCINWFGQTDEHKSFRTYPKVKDLSKYFVDFLSASDPTTWTAAESSATLQLIQLDWTDRLLVSPLNAEQFVALATKPYTDQLMRMYMVLSIQQLHDSAQRISIAHTFFKDDPSQTVRDLAFEVLAKLGWQLTDEMAEEYWNSGESLKRVVALRCLFAARSQMLSTYLDIALSSKDKALRSAARGLRGLSSG